jgi:hypothetical protein
VAFSFVVQAEKPGQHTIGPVKVTADGKTYLKTYYSILQGQLNSDTT